MNLLGCHGDSTVVIMRRKLSARDNRWLVVRSARCSRKLSTVDHELFFFMCASGLDSRFSVKAFQCPCLSSSEKSQRWSFVQTLKTSCVPVPPHFAFMQVMAVLYRTQGQKLFQKPSQEIKVDGWVQLKLFLSPKPKLKAALIDYLAITMEAADQAVNTTLTCSQFPVYAPSWHRAPYSEQSTVVCSHNEGKPNISCLF